MRSHCFRGDLGRADVYVDREERGRWSNCIIVRGVLIAKEDGGVRFGDGVMKKSGLLSVFSRSFFIWEQNKRELKQKCLRTKKKSTSSSTGWNIFFVFTFKTIQRNSHFKTENLL